MSRRASSLRATALAVAALAGEVFVAFVALVAEAPAAHAQSATTGAIAGVITERQSGEPLPGIVLELASRNLLGKRAAITDERGAYKITELPPGEYVVTFFYDRLTVKRAGISVGVQKTTPVFQAIDLDELLRAGGGANRGAGEARGGEVIFLEDAAPAIDPTSTTQGVTIEGRAVVRLPTAGRSFEDTLTIAAGAQQDRLGAAFSGSTSLENQYTVDGHNTTSLRFGASGSPVIHDFVEETEVITGGYNAEYGRSSGAVINVATKSGSNVLGGSVFSYFSAGALAGDPQRTQTQGSSIDSFSKSVYDTSVGFELGGPLLEDHLFFFVGFAPRRGATDTTRITKRQTDCRGLDPRTGGLSAQCDPRPLAEGGLADGVPDRVPATQQLLYEDLDRQRRGGTSASYSAIAKLSFAATPDHQGQVSLLADHSRVRTPGVVGLPDTGLDTENLALDGVARWTSKLHGGKTELEAVAGWHRADIDIDATEDRLNDEPAQRLVGGHLADYAGFGGESTRTAERCRDGGPLDPYPLIANCPMNSEPYFTGGPGIINRGAEERRSGRLGVLRRFEALGSHELKGGFDLEQNLRSSPRLFSGGAFLQNFVGQLVNVQRFAKLAPPDATDLSPYDQLCRTVGPDGAPLYLPCTTLGSREGSFGTSVDGGTLNWAAYLRDSWRPLPELTLNFGLRYEEQRLRYADQVRGQRSPLGGERFGKNAMVLRDQWAPRLGLLYDWTSVGRAKAYAHWGRYYESIPLALNDRAFGGETVYRQDFSPAQCGENDPRIGGPDGRVCLDNGATGELGEALLGASGILIAPGIEGQYLDETLGGVEYELLPDLVLGAAVQHRRLGRVIEDVSPDGANTYIVANPGSFSAAQERALEERLAATADPREQERLATQLSLYRGIRLFERPQRDYTALTLTARHRLTEALYFQASYTYARTRGNYPGTLSYDTLQIDPNNSSQYDLVDLLGNRRGPLPQDRPHFLKLDGYYVFELSRRDQLTVGARFRFSSGAPISALGAHPLYGANEVFLLPRGALGRTEPDHNLSLRVSYARALPRGMTLEVFADVYNVYDRQSTATVDQTYAPQQANNNSRAIAGGSYEDLIWLKAGDGAGRETDDSGLPYGPSTGNLNFRNTTARSAPIASQFGLRLLF